MRRLAIIVVLTACGGGPPAPATPAAPARRAPSCAAAADGMVGMLLANKDPKPADEVGDRYRILIRQRCEQDAWSPAAQRCLADMKTADDANVCGTLLSDDQQAALVKAQDQTQK